MSEYTCELETEMTWWRLLWPHIWGLDGRRVQEEPKINI